MVQSASCRNILVTVFSPFFQLVITFSRWLFTYFARNNGLPCWLIRIKKKIAPTYFCDFLSANMSLGKNFISLILMLLFSLSVAAWLRTSLGVPACLELFSCCCWVISFASVCLSDLFFCAAYNWHPVILSKLYENKMYCSLEGEQLLDPCVFSTCSFWNTFFF